jgi:hypothetical protein
MVLTAMNLSKPLLTELHRLAREEDRSMASIVRQFISEALARQRRQAAQQK